ncbi:trna splicing endonuclease [Cystoisospora suis]|uniref:Trna splicing endonuclease n=1 Tax=Cystoisospora suis TaxID=483139 RepID=A0A2C6L7F8_9APIC|nr:trna splicing endonuclease [Cystoisospora suis]
MLLPDEDENLIFAPPYLRSSRLSFLFSSSSSLHDSSSSSFAQEETSSSLQELPTAEDLLGLSDVDDDDETYAAILDSLQRLETHLSISSSSSSSFPRSSSSSSSSSVAFGRQHVFCVPELRRDGLRVLFLLSFEFEEEEENTLGRRVSLILSSLSDSLARCPACVVQYLSLSRLLLLALRRRELQSFTSLGARGRERNHLTASSVYEGRRTQDNKHESEATRDEDEEEDQQRGGEGEEGGCKRLQRQLLAWDLLRIVRSLRELKEDEEEEEENNEGDKFKKRKDVADGKKEGTSFRGEGGENGGGLFANREGHSRDEMAGEDEGDEEKKKERETTKRKKRGLSAVAAEAAAAAAAGDAATLMKTRRISTSSLTCGVNKRENDDGGGRDDSFEFPCNKFECIDSWMSPLLSFRSRVMNQVLARLSSTLRNESSFSLTTGESSLEEEFILDRMLRASCVLLEILLDSGRLLCPHFSFPLGDLTDDLRAVSSSLPSFLLSILTYTTQRFISSRKRLARFLAESLKRRTERVRIKPPSLLERYLSFLSSDDEQRPREDIKRRSNISDTVEGRQQIGERSNQQEHPGWLLASMKGMRLFSTGRRGENKEVFIKKEENSIQGHDGRKEKETVADKNETREDILSTLQHHQWSSHEISLESHQHLYDSLEGLQNFLRCHKELFNTIVSHLHHHTSFSSSSLSFSLDMNQLPPSFPSALSVPPPVFILPLLPSPLFFLHAVFFSLLLFPLEVAPVLLSLQTHSFPTIRLIACAALHLATIRRHHLSRHQHSHPSFSSSSSSLSNPVLSKCPADAKCTAVHDPRCGYSPLSSHTEEISASPSSLSQASRVSQTPLGQKEEKGIKGTSPSSTARSPVSLGSTCSSCSTSSCVISLVKGSCPSIASPSSLLFPFSTDVTSRMGMVVKQWMTLLRILSMSLSRGYERYQEVLVKRSEEDSEVEVIRVEGELPGGKKKNEEMKTIHDNDAYDSIVSDLGGTLEHLSLILRALHSLFIVVLPPQSTLSGHASQGGALVLSQSFVDEERFRSMKVMTSRESEENFSSSSSVGLSVTMKSAVSEFDHVVLHEKEDLGESSLSLSATSNQEENRSSLDSTFPRLKRKWMTSSGTDSKRANKKGSTLVKPLTNRCGVCTPSIPGLASVGALLEEGIAGTASACVSSFRSILNHMRSHQRDQSDGSNFASFCTRRGKQDETASSSISPLEKKDSCLSEVRVKTEKDKDPLPQVHNRCDGPSSTLPPEQKDYSRPSLACKTINSSSSVVDDRSVNDRDDEHGQEEEKSVLSFFENEEVKSLTKSEEMFIVGCHPAFLPLSSKSSLNTGKDNCEERESVYFLLGSPPSATKTTCHTSSLSSSSSSSPASSPSLLSLKVLLNSLEDVLRGLLSIWQMELSRRREQGSLVSTPASLCYRDGTDFSRTKKNEDKHASFMRDEGDSKGTILSSQHTKKEPSLLVTGKECEREEEKADVCRNKRDALARDIKKKEEGHAGVKEKNLKTEANVLEEDLLNSISRHDEDECRKIVFARTLCSSYEKDRSLFEICVLQNLLYTLALLGKLFASSISRPSSSFCSNSSLHLLSTGKEPPEGENDGRQAQKSSAHNGHAMPYTEDQKESRKEERRLESLLDEGSLYRWRNLFHGVHTEAEGRRKELRSKYSHRPSQCDSSSLHANSRDGKQSPLVISSKESNSVGTALKERGGVESNEEKRLSCREERAREIKTEEETFSSSTYTSHQIEDTSLLRGTCWCCAKISVMLDDLLNFLVQQEADIKLHRGSSTSSREKAEEEFCEQLNEKKKRCEGIHSQEKGESKGAEDEQGDRRQLTKYGDPLNDSSSSSLVDQTDISVGRERCLLQGEKERKVLSSEEVEVVMERLPHRQKITVPKANEEDKRLSVYENLSAGGKAQSHFHTPLQEKEQQEKIGEKVKIGEEVKIEEETKVEEEEQEKIEGEEVPRKETKTSAGKDEGAAISSVGVDDFLLRSSPSSTSCGQQEVVEVVVEADSSGIEKGIASDVSMDEDKKSRGKSTVSGGEDPSEIELKGGVEEEEEEDFLTRRLREEILQNSPWYKAQDFRDANKSISTTHWSRSHGDVRDVSFLMNKSPPGERGVDDEDGEERELIHIKDQIEKNKKEEEEQQQEVILIEDDDDETIPSLKRGGRPDVNEEEDVEEDEWKERDMHNDEETDLEDFALPPSTAREVSFTMKQTGGKENPDAVRRNDSFISCDQDERENDEDQQATVNERGGTVSLPSSIHRSGGLEEQAPQTSVGGDRLKGHDEAKEEEGRETLREEEKNGSQPDVTPRRTSLSPQERRNVGGVSSLPPVQGEDLEIVLSDDYSSEEEMRRLACLARASQESKKNSPSKKDKKGRGEDDDDDMWGSDLDDLLATQFTQEVETRRFAGGGRRRRLHKHRDEGHTEDDEEGKGEEEEDDDLRFFKGRSFPPSSSSLSPRRPEFLEKKTMTVTGASPSSSSLHIEETDEPEFLTVDTDEELRILEVSRGRKKRRRGSRKTPLTREQREQEVRDFFQQMAGEGEDDDGERFLTHRPVDKAWRKEREKTTTSTMRSVSPSSDVSSISSPSDVDPISAYSSCVSSPSRTSSLEDLKRMGKQRIIPPHDTISGTAGTRSLHKTNVSSSSLTNILFPESFSSTGPGVGSKKKSIQESERGIEELWETAAQAESLQQKETKKRKIREDLHLAQERQAETLKRSHEQTSLQSSSSSLSPSAGAAGGKQRVFIPAGCFGTTSLGGSKAFGAGYEKLARKEATDAARKMLMMNMTGGVFPANEEGQQHPSLYHSKEETEKFKASSSSTQSRNTMQNIFPSSSSLCTTEDPICTSSPNDCLSSSASPPFSVHNDRKASRSTSISPPPVSSSLPASSSSPPPSLHVLSRSTSVQQVRAAAAAEKIDLRRRAQQMLSACLSGLAKEGERKLTTSGKSSGAVGNLHGGIQSPPLLPSDGTAPRQPISLGHQRGLSGLLLQEQHHDPHHQHFQQKSREDPYANLTGYRFTSSRKKKPFLLKGSLGKVAQKIGYDGSLVRKALPSDRHRRVLSADYSDSSSRGMKTNEHQDASSHFADSRSLMGEGMRHQQQHHQGQERGEEKEGREKDKSNDQGQKDMSEQIWKELEQEAKRQEQVRKMMKAQQQQRHQEEKGLSKSRGNLSSSSSTGGVGVVAIGGVRVLSAKNPIPPLMKGSSSSSRQIDAKPSTTHVTTTGKKIHGGVCPNPSSSLALPRGLIFYLLSSSSILCK